MKTKLLKLTGFVFFVFIFLAAAPLTSAQENSQETKAAKTQIQIKSKFDAVKLTKETYGKEVNKCIPTLSADSPLLKDNIKSFPSNAITTYQNQNVASVFAVHKSTGLCLKLSPEKHPIFAAEAFIETINPNGVSQNIMDDWYKQIASMIAKKGSAKIAYAFDNGNAFIVTYYVQPERADQLLYSMEFRKAGSWENEKLDIKFTHPSLSGVNETKRGGKGIKPYLLLHRNL